MSDLPAQKNRISIDEFDSYHEFNNKLMHGDLPMPCWLEVGEAGFKITKENHQALSLGMLLEMELRAYFKR